MQLGRMLTDPDMLRQMTQVMSNPVGAEAAAVGHAGPGCECFWSKSSVPADWAGRHADQIGRAHV